MGRPVKERPAEIPPPPPLDIGDRLRRRREQKQISLRDLAALAGVSQKTIVDLESGRSTDPYVVTIQRLAIALKCKPAWLAFG